MYVVPHCLFASLSHRVRLVVVQVEAGGKGTGRLDRLAVLVCASRWMRKGMRYVLNGADGGKLPESCLWCERPRTWWLRGGDCGILGSLHGVEVSCGPLVSERIGASAGMVTVFAFESIISSQSHPICAEGEML